MHIAQKEMLNLRSYNEINKMNEKIIEKDKTLCYILFNKIGNVTGNVLRKGENRI